MNEEQERFLRKLHINSRYGCVDYSQFGMDMETLRSISIDPIKPKRSIKAHSFIKKDFTGGLARFLPLHINYDYSSLYPTR